MVQRTCHREVPAPAAAGRSSALGPNAERAGFKPRCSRCGESSAFGRRALGSEHALDDEIREAAAHLRQLIFNRKDGHRLARDRCRIQPAEHLEQLVDFLKNVLERQWLVRSGHGGQYSRNGLQVQLLNVVVRTGARVSGAPASRRTGLTRAQWDDDAMGARPNLPQATNAASAPKPPVKGSAEISPRVM